MANDVLITPASGQIDFCCGTSISKICNINGEMKQEGGALTFCTAFLPSHGGPTSYGKLYQNRVTEDYSDYWGSGGTAARTNLWYKGQGTGAAAQNLSRCGNCAFEIICSHRTTADAPEKILYFNSPPNKGSFDWARFYKVRIYIDWAHSITQSCGAELTQTLTVSSTSGWGVGETLTGATSGAVGLIISGTSTSVIVQMSTTAAVFISGESATEGSTPRTLTAVSALMDSPNSTVFSHLGYADNYNSLYLNFNNLRSSFWTDSGLSQPGGFSTKIWSAAGYCRGFGSQWFTWGTGGALPTGELHVDINITSIAYGNSYSNTGPSQWYSTFELYPHCGSGTGSGSNQYYTYHWTTFKLIRPRDASNTCQFVRCAKGILMKGECDWDLDTISSLNIYSHANYCRCPNGWNLTRHHCYGGIKAGSKITIIGFCR